MKVRLIYQLSLAINTDTNSTSCLQELPIYQVAVPRARNIVECDLLVLTYLACILTRPEHLLEASGINLLRLQWFGYSVVRGIREFLVKTVLTKYSNWKVGIPDDSNTEVCRQIQDVVAAEEQFYDEVDLVEFKKFIAQGGIEKMKLNEEELEKIKVEFFYENC